MVAFFLAYRLHDPFGAYTAKDNCLTCGKKASEPVHLSTCMIKGRNAEENVVAALRMVTLLSFAGADESAVSVEDSLGESCCTGGEVDRCIVILGDGHRGRSGCAVCGINAVAVSSLGYVVANEEEVLDSCELILNLSHTVDKLGTVDKQGGV